MKFEWDARKAAENLRRHGVSFEEATTAFADPCAIEHYDVEHSQTEERSVTIGISQRLRLLFVVHTQRYGDTIRIISARKVNQTEAHEYAEAQG